MLREMEIEHEGAKTAVEARWRHTGLLLGALVLLGLYLCSLHSYLLFHSLAELFSIAVAVSIFMIVWNSRRFLDNNYLLFIGVAYMFVGGVDMIHTLAYQGMGIFPPDGNLATQLWISARYLQSLSLLIAPFMLNRKPRTWLIIAAYSATVFLLFLSIFVVHVFPTCFVDGAGLTTFKRVSEYVISLLLLASVGLLLRKRTAFDPVVFRWILWSVILTALSELAFTFYLNVYGLSNLMGHFFKIAAFYFLYKAIVVTGLSRPYDLLFRNLKQSEAALRESEESLRTAHDDLERRVEERAAEILNTAALLKLFAVKLSRKEYLDEVVGLISNWTGCEAVGIRVVDENDYLPYESYLGYTREFWEKENRLCLATDKCACTRVALGRNDPQDVPYLTAIGSFHCKDTRELVAMLSGEEQVRFRGTCIGEGYRTLAVISVRYRERIIGAVHLADRAEGKLTASIVSFLESVSPLIGEAIHRFDLEKKLQKSEEKYRSIFENALEGIFQVTRDGRYLSANPALVRMLGFDSAETMTDPRSSFHHDIYADPSDRERLVGILDERGSVEGFVTQARRRDGGVIWVSINATVVHDADGEETYYEGTMEDITQQKQKETEQKKLEAQLRQAQKMDALGTLTGGIAHDFNNILAAIIGFSEMASSRTPEGSREQHYMQRVLEAGVRGRELIKQMLLFSRRTEQEKKPLQLSSAIKETMKLLRASIPTTIDVKLKVESESGLILGDPVQIQQVVMNLCTNAAHAMREKGGLLTVELTDFSVAPSEAPGDGLKPGLYMRLAVSDTGSGIAPEIMDRIFDPFFTTKKPDEGTGLGLSVVHGIVQQHGARIVVESNLKKGSTFTVYFPKVAESGARQAPADEAVPTGRERVLFVDDEPALVEMGQELLRELGYQVTAKASSREALALFRTEPDRFDVVVTDYTMPDMTGLELAKELTAIKPGIRLILTTGFSQLIDGGQARDAGICAFVMKPLTRAEMARTLRKVLEENGDST